MRRSSLRRTRAQARADSERDDDTVHHAALAAIAELGGAWPPGEARMQAARAAAEAVLWPAMLGETPDAALAECRLRNAWPVPRLPPPQILREVPPLRLMFAAGLGAIGGMMILGPIARAVAPTPDVGALTATLLGAPLGAAALVGALLKAADSERLHRILLGLLGMGAATEIAAMLAATMPWGALWRQVGRGRGVPRRLVLFAAAAGILALTRRARRIDRAGTRSATKALFALWLQGARVQLQAAAGTGGSTADGRPEALLAELAERIDTLRQSADATDARAVAEELLQRLRNRGVVVEPPDGSPARWDDALRERYETFGHIDPGQPVVIERAPVLQDGRLLRKGLARRRRNGGAP